MAFQYCCHWSNVCLGCQETQELQEGVQGLSSQQNFYDSFHCINLLSFAIISLSLSLFASIALYNITK